jgi:hypothetical protein
VFHIYVIQPPAQEGGKSFWHRAGVAFKNNDGSFNLKLDLFPGVSLQLRETKSDAQEPEGETNGSQRRPARSR